MNLRFVYSIGMISMLSILGCSQSKVNQTQQVPTATKNNLNVLTKTKEKPNILWIITDDQRADSIAAFNKSQTGNQHSKLGYVYSPNIDKLAKEGVMFTHAYTNSPACAPSRSSMIMGLYPHHSGRFGFERTHDQHDLMTRPIPVVLRDEGYQTALFGKKGVRIYQYKNGPTWKSLGFYDQVIDMKNDLALKNQTDFAKIDHYDENWKHTGKTERFIFPNQRIIDLPVAKDFDPASSEIDQELELLRSYTRSQKTLIIGGQSPQPAGETLDGHILKSFKQYLASQDKSYKTPTGKAFSGPKSEQPLMVNLGFHFPHTPVLPPKSFRDQFKNKQYQIPNFSQQEVSKLPKQMAKLYQNLKTSDLTEAEKQQAIADYYAFCAYGDHLIGQAVEAFKEYNQAQGKDYLILLTVGDHGWQLGEQGIEAKFSPWNTSNQGVLVVVDSKQQRFPKDKIVNDFVEYVDIAPTLLAAAGVDVTQETHLDGFDLAKVIRTPSLKRDYVIGELNAIVGPRVYLRSKEFAFSMRVRKQNGFPGQGYAPGENIKWALTAPDQQLEMALYDLSCDTNEQNNVAYDKEYQVLTNFFRDKLRNITLGDGRVEVNWSKPNSYHISNFALGAHNHKLGGLEQLTRPSC